MLEEADDEVRRWVGGPGGDEVYGSGRNSIQVYGRTISDRPGGSRLREETAM